jgi:hypothetical protein
MNLTNFTSVGRPLDMKDPSSRAILIISLSVFLISVIYLLVVGSSLLESVSIGLGVAASVFFAWALCRELDPDYKSSAFVAATLALFSSFVFYPPDFAGIVWLLLMLRIITRSTGLQPTYFDSIIATILAGYLMYRGDWQYGLFAIIAFVADSLLKPVYRRQLYFASIMAIFLTLVFIYRDYPEYQTSSLHLVMSTLIICVIFIPYIISSKKIRSRSDNTLQHLSPVRIQAAQIFSITLGLVFLLTQGKEGFQKHIVLWSAILAIGLYFYYRMLKGKN